MDSHTSTNSPQTSYSVQSLVYLGNSSYYPHCRPTYMRSYGYCEGRMGRRANWCIDINTHLLRRELWIQKGPMTWTLMCVGIKEDLLTAGRGN